MFSPHPMAGGRAGSEGLSPGPRLSPHLLASLALLFAGLGALGASVAGCTGMTNGSPLVIGPYEIPPPESFGRLIAASRREGYPPMQIDYERGNFRVRSRTASISEDAFFLIQCSRRGWVQVRPIGRRVLGNEAELRLTDELDRELHDLTLALARAMSAPASGASARTGGGQGS